MPRFVPTDWMESRIRIVIRLYGFLLLGGVLLVAPWTTLWGEAAPILLPSWFLPWVLSGWVRGAVSGLGALDLLVAVQLARELWQETHPRTTDADRP